MLFLHFYSQTDTHAHMVLQIYLQEHVKGAIIEE